MTDTGRIRGEAVSEKSFVHVNGDLQGMFIRSTSADNPVLLYLHGGMPDYFLTGRHPTGLERYFTVVWWEQRGSGISYRPNRPPVTTEQLMEDTLALTEHLRRRFRQDQVYLMAHSGGTFTGIQAAARAPHLYKAYLAVAQIAHQLESEVIAWRYMLEECERRGYRRIARRLAAAPVTRESGTPEAYLRIRDVAMHRLGIGTMHEMRSILTGLFLPSLLFPEYTAREKIRFWRAKASSGPSTLWQTILATDLRERVREVGVPVYFMHGTHDYTCSYPLARSYLERLESPVKGFYSFPDSAHSPLFEEPERFQRIMREDVLQGRTTLADEVPTLPTTGRAL
jgi:pimeloyl-ACP methyl ester carboxylesterase